MFRLYGPVRNISFVACSGGVDSMALLSFLRKVNKSIKVAFFHHGTQTSDEALTFINHYCEENNINLYTGFIADHSKPKSDSWEEWWRKERYKFLHSLNDTVATAHHLDDVAETYLFSFLHGTPKFINYRYRKVVRPILLTPKSELISWCNRHRIPYIEDATNEDVNFARNRIRHRIMPEVFKINPGFLKVTARQLYQHLLQAEGSNA